MTQSSPETSPPSPRSAPREREAPATRPAPSPLRLALATLLTQEGFTPPLTLERMEVLAENVENGAGVEHLSAAEHGWLLELRAATVYEWAAAPPPLRPDLAVLLAAFDRALAAPRVDAVVELAHDLRSPLTSILFLADALRAEQPAPLSDVRGRQVEIIYSAALSAVSMTSDIVDYFQSSRVGPHADVATFSVRGVMDSVRDMLLPMVEEGKVELRLAYPPEGARIGSPAAVGRVLLNLASNSLRLTRRGHVEIAAAEPQPGCLRFTVRDTGPGIDPEMMATLFEPFRPRRGHPGMAFSGTGLGLGICRKILHAAGSELEVESAPGEGTIFAFTLSLPRAGQP